MHTKRFLTSSELRRHLRRAGAALGAKLAEAVTTQCEAGPIDPDATAVVVRAGIRSASDAFRGAGISEAMCAYYERHAGQSYLAALQGSASDKFSFAANASRSRAGIRGEGI